MTPVMLFAAICLSVTAITLNLVNEISPQPVRVVTSPYCPAVDFVPMGGRGFGFPVEP